MPPEPTPEVTPEATGESGGPDGLTKLVIGLLATAAVLGAAGGYGLYVTKDRA